MPFTGVEQLEVAVGTPRAGCVVDNRWVFEMDAGRPSPPGVLPLQGAFTVTDALDGSTRVFATGGTLVAAAASAAAAGGYAFWNVWTLGILRISPSNPAGFETITTAANSGIAAVSDNVLCRILNSAVTFVDLDGNPIGTSTTVSSPRPGVRVSGNRVVIPSMSTSAQPARVFDADGTLLTTTHTTGTSSQAGTIGQGVGIGSTAYIPRTGANFIYGVDADGGSGAAPTLSIAPYVCGDNLTVDSHGWLVTYDPVNDVLVAVSPITGVVDVGTMPTSRGRRYIVQAANGQLWVPSGEPL